MKTFTVGQLAKKANVNVETVRYYEQRRLLPEPARSESKYRQYTEKDVARIVFVRRAKELGFTLKEISELLSLKLDSETICGDVQKLAAQKITDIEKRMTDLRKIKKKLEELIKLCDLGSVATSACPILEALEPINQETRRSK